MEIASPRELVNIDEVHEWLSSCSRVYSLMKPGQLLQINLKRLKWVSPVGSAALMTTLHKLSKKFMLRVFIPDNSSADGVIGYLERMDFFKVCPVIVKEAFEKSCDMAVYYERRRNDKTNALFELREVDRYNDVGPLQKAVREIMRGRMSDNRISDIASIIGELANNSLEHGESPCFPCVQYYPKNKKVEIAICDYGKGIIESLKDHVQGESDLDIVREAIFTDASGKRTENRGRGLMDVRERTFNWSKETDFFLITNRSAYKVLDSNVKLLGTKNCDFGTYYYIVIHLPE